MSGEGRLHRQGAGGALHAAQVQDHEEQILRLVHHHFSYVSLKAFYDEINVAVH